MASGHIKSDCQSAVRGKNEKINQTIRELNASIRAMEFKNAREYRAMDHTINDVVKELRNVKERLNAQWFE